MFSVSGHPSKSIIFEVLPEPPSPPFIASSFLSLTKI